MIKPLFNQCKIEIIDDYAGVIRNDTDEQVQKGKLESFELYPYHLTASTGWDIELAEIEQVLLGLLGKVVHYSEYADSGQVIEENGKKYAFVPFYRIIGVEED